MPHYAIVDAAGSLQWVGEAEDAAAALGKLAADVGPVPVEVAGSGYLTAQRVSADLASRLADVDGADDLGDALLFDEVMSALVPLDASELDRNLRCELGAGHVELYEAWLTSTAGYQFAFCPGAGRLGGVFAGSGSSGHTAWCDAPTLEDGVFAYLKGDTE